MSIKYNEVNFSEPERLSNWAPPYRAGLYVIMVPDQNMKPKPYRAIYFGESGNMSERGFNSHHKKNCWINTAGSEGNLFISTHLMPDSSEKERRNIEERLVQEYNTNRYCND